MGSRIVYDQYFREINSLVDILGKYVNSYRLLIGSAGELNSIALAKKGDVKDTLKRVEEIGDLIDCLVDTLDCAQCNYIEYLKIKGTILQVEISKEIILTEIDNELKFQNDQRDDPKDD
ncbi:hypothetical protein [uncultured Clostridium sp.]|uniref:hypothetical protein n=1 Tax=uncultured Clostridium sp. TaxID=59620 RepID=UPI002605161A|nr:hypothetical protein [uncultured Clostridium sp.]